MTKYVPSPVEVERRNRIHVLLWAYAYEFLSESLVSDAKFDETCMMIDTKVDTGRPDLDEWFKSDFSPYTGQWIHSFPELEKVKKLYERLYGQQQ